MDQMSASQHASEVVAGQADILMRRLLDLEQGLSVREWWLLGRQIPEAQALAEVVSLLAVARAELDQVLVQYYGRPPSEPVAPAEETAEGAPAADPASLARQRALAAQLMQMLGAALPPTTAFAQQLRLYAQRAGLDAVAVDTLGIVTDRLMDAQEALMNMGR
jgi:hypothetical protein